LDSEAITERLENSLGDVKIVKSDDIWSQNLLANDEQLDDIVPTNDPSDSSDSAASNNGIITSNHSSANKNGATTNGESSANKNSAIINNKVPAMPSTSKASTGHNHRALNGLNGNGESSKSPDSGTVPSEQPQAEEAPLANESMDISENTSRASISNVEIPARVKRKRKLVDYTEDDNVQEKLATEISMIVSSESLDTPDQNSTDKRKTKKRKTNEKDEIPEKTNIPNNAEHESAPTNDKKRKAQDKTLPPPKTRKGKKPLPKEDSSDWSDSEIEDDLEFLSHFDEPF
jgi:hypothetical protein